jgi:hypothetical protein
METTEERWLRWDGLIIEKKYLQVAKEFDLLFLKKVNLTIGDLVRRDEALELMGVASFSKEKAKKQEVIDRDGFRKGKS